MSITLISLLLLVTFLAWGFSFPTEENNNVFPTNLISDNNEVHMNILDEKPLNGIDFPAGFCDNLYTKMCREDVNHARPAYLKRYYQQIREHLINILSSPVGSAHEVKALSVEKQLFHKCMNLGSKSDAENKFETMNFVSDLFQQVLDTDQVWQNIDDHLSVQGFGFTFYDIGVERDPENPNQNIITLQPPSYSKIESIFELVRSAFDAKNYQKMSDNFAWRFYHSVNQEAIKKFYQEWLKAFLHSTTQHKHAGVKNAKMTVSDWNNEYNTRSFHRITSKIDWEKLIADTFAKVNIPVTGKENIIIKNKDYFLFLTDVLGSVPNDVIVGAIKSKVIAENLRYIDWKTADSLEHKKRSLFCFEDTKLYGASFRLLRDLKKEDSSNAPNYEMLKMILHNIASVTESEITHSNNLSSKEKTFLKSQVKLITSDIVNHNKYRSTIDNYYGNYEVSPSYFVSIVKYRKMLKEKELSSLKDHSTSLPETLPFSVTDLAKPRNRFILNVFANSFLLSKEHQEYLTGQTEKASSYAIYGTTIASFLYGLLNENRFEDDVIVRQGRVNWFDHPDYPAKSLQCFVGDDLRLYGRALAAETVTQIFGVRIAYQAMLKDYRVSGAETLPRQSVDRLFFVVYVKYHCELSQKVIDTVLSNIKEVDAALSCPSNQQGIQSKQCSLKSFEIQHKGHFLNRSL